MATQTNSGGEVQTSILPINAPSNSRQSSRQGWLFLSLATLVFATALPASKFVTAEVSVLQGTAMRMAIAGILFAPVLWRSRNELRALHEFGLARVLLIGGTVAATSCCMLCSTRLTPCSTVCMVTSLGPLVTAVVATWIFNESGHRRQWIWILFGVAATLGCHGLLFPESRANLGANNLAVVGMMLAFGATFFDATGTLLSKSAMQSVSPLVLTAVSCTLAAGLVAPAVWFEEPTFSPHLSPRAWIALGWWGAGSLALGTWFWYRGLQMTDGMTAAAFSCGLPFATLLMSWLSAA